VLIWYIFSGFGIAHEEKSGSPASDKKKVASIHFCAQCMDSFSSNYIANDKTIYSISGRRGADFTKKVARKYHSVYLRQKMWMSGL
jgi:hypothetical protein